jgi:hypothetical protein
MKEQEIIKENQDKITEMTNMITFHERELELLKSSRRHLMRLNEGIRGQLALADVG